MNLVDNRNVIADQWHLNFFSANLILPVSQIFILVNDADTVEVRDLNIEWLRFFVKKNCLPCFWHFIFVGYVACTFFG